MKKAANIRTAKARKKKKEPKIDRSPGFMKGKIKILKGFYDPLPDQILKAFLGEGD